MAQVDRLVAAGHVLVGLRQRPLLVAGREHEGDATRAQGIRDRIGLLTPEVHVQDLSFSGEAQPDSPKPGKAR